MSYTSIMSALHKVRGFASDRRGVSAIEFAIIAPLMITLYLGGVEVSQAVAVNRKTTLVAHTVADLVAQTSSVANSDMTDVLNASSSVAAPYSVANLSVTVSSVVINSSGVAKVSWSDTMHGTARAVGSTITLDPALAVPNTSLILGEVSYSYKPTFGWVITGTLTLSDKTYLRPRITQCVNRPPVVTACP
jgi:Flp pilus assembly protein TadG